MMDGRRKNNEGTTTKERSSSTIGTSHTDEANTPPIVGLPNVKCCHSTRSRHDDVNRKGTYSVSENEGRVDVSMKE